MLAFLKSIYNYFAKYLSPELKFITVTTATLYDNRHLYLNLTDINDCEYSINERLPKLSGPRLTFRKIVSQCKHKVYVAFYKNTDTILAAVIEYTDKDTSEVTRYYYINSYLTTPKEMEQIRNTIKQKFNF